MERRKFSAQFKQQVVRECSETGNVPLVARKYELHDTVIRRWIKQASQNGGKMPGTTHVTREELLQLNAERSELASENEKLRKALADQALENSILRDLVKKANPHLRIK